MLSLPRGADDIMCIHEKVNESLLTESLVVLLQLVWDQWSWWGFRNSRNLKVGHFLEMSRCSGLDALCVPPPTYGSLMAVCVCMCVLLLSAYLTFACLFCQSHK